MTHNALGKTPSQIIVDKLQGNRLQLHTDAKSRRHPLNESLIMYASIFTAAKRTGAKWELVIHNAPGLSGESVIAQYYFQSKPDAKRAALALGAKAYNY